jgi:hypothetical protein
MRVFETDPPPPYLADRTQVSAATELIVRYGVHAAAEASARADASRDVGNHIHFCRWRQVGRLIDWLAAGRASGTIH